MPAVYVANATKQYVDFSYRLPERKSLVTIRIPMLSQVQLSPKDMSQPEVSAVMAQWEKYGILDASKLERVPETFAGYLISVGKPVPSARLQKAVAYRDLVLEAQGRKTRTEAALAMAQSIELATGNETPARQYEISVAEIEPEGGFTNPQDTHLAEGFRVTNDGLPPASERQASGRRRRRV